MPIQVYRCPDHREFEVLLQIGERVPTFKLCPTIIEYHGSHSRGCFAGSQCGRYECRNRSPWVPQVPAFPGGPTTGAKPPAIEEGD